jgi:hypothetical protein
MLLQAEIAGEIVQNTFDANPDTIFGILISVLILGLGILAYAMWKLVDSHKTEMAKMHKDHKDELSEIYQRHAKSDMDKYIALTEISNKTLENLGSMTAKIDELIRSK